MVKSRGLFILYRCNVIYLYYLPFWLKYRFGCIYYGSGPILVIFWSYVGHSNESKMTFWKECRWMTVILFVLSDIIFLKIGILLNTKYIFDSIFIDLQKITVYLRKLASKKYNNDKTWYNFLTKYYFYNIVLVMLRHKIHLGRDFTLFCSMLLWE